MSGGEDVLVKEEFLLPDPRRSSSPSSSSAAGDGGDNKKGRRRGRNKDRPPPVKFARSSRLCPVLVDVPEGAAGAPQCHFPNCAFQHDVGKYLEGKPRRPEGLEAVDGCHVFRALGKCPRGVTCVFSDDHVVVGEEDGVARNVVDGKKVEARGEAPEEANHLGKELQGRLWKKKVDFSEVDEIVNAIYERRQKEREDDRDKEVEENGNGEEGAAHGDAAQAEVKPEQPPPPKVSKVEVEEEAKGDPDGRRPQAKATIDWSDKLYLAPLTTVGNLPFRRVCKRLGADVTCGEMAMGLQLLQGHKPEWALVQRHRSEDLFGVQLCGGNPHQMARAARLVEDHVDCDFVDVNLGCPIDLVYKKGMGSGLMVRRKPLEVMIRSMSAILTRPLTVKMRTGVYADKPVAHELLPQMKSWGVSMVTLHGRSREQRYTRLADWEYVSRCVEAAAPMPLCGNGDVLSYEDYLRQKELSKCSSIMIARGALIKPWIFTEIKENRHWDISASERLDVVKEFANYGLEHWGSDDKGVETTRRFLLEWLSFLHRYVPVGLLERPPQRLNQRVPRYSGRGDAETLLSSPDCADWIRISEMFLGKVPEGFRFEPKHGAHAYK